MTIVMPVSLWTRLKSAMISFSVSSSRSLLGSSASSSSGSIDQRPGDDDALLLAGRELARVRAAAIAEPDHLQQLERPCLSVRGTVPCRRRAAG